MDKMAGTLNISQIMDSVYTNSYSTSQSRSSKSTRSWSIHSTSSGYGGKRSTSGSSDIPVAHKIKKKAQVQPESQVPTEKVDVIKPPEPKPKFHPLEEEPCDVVQVTSPAHSQTEMFLESMEVSPQDRNSNNGENGVCASVRSEATANVVTTRPASSFSCEGFSCVISMHDGVVMYTTSTITFSLGFPKDMWIGRSFIDFVHPNDRNTFASQITKGLAAPKNNNDLPGKAQLNGDSTSTLFCRIRRYRGLSNGFGVKDKTVTHLPFLIKLSFKNINDEEGNDIFLVIQATPFPSAFKLPNEVLTKDVSFVIRHVANGNMDYIDPEAVPYLGYLPQDVIDKDTLRLYHPDDLTYLRQIYETIVKEGSVMRCKPYRMKTQNGDYLKLETEWSSFINPWSRKLEFVIGKHHVIEGPTNPDVFQAPADDKGTKLSEEEKTKIQSTKDDVIRILNEVLTKPAEVAKQQMSKRCQDLAAFMENLWEDTLKIDDELGLEIHDPEHNYYERDSVMLGGISPYQDFSDSKSSTDTPLSYNQLTYNENLQRYFNSLMPYSNEDDDIMTGDNNVENKLVVKDSRHFVRDNEYPIASTSGNSGNSGDITDMVIPKVVLDLCDSAALLNGNVGASAAYQPAWLTEVLLTNHDTIMERELVKKHRDNRSCSKDGRRKSFDNRKKMKEHLARCNTTYQTVTTAVDTQAHGLKRPMKQLDCDMGSHKHHCTSYRQLRRRQVGNTAHAHQSTVIPPLAVSHWPVSSMSNLVPGIGITQQMPIMSPVAAMPGMFPMYYVPTAATTAPQIQPRQNQNAITSNNGHISGLAMQYMMYGQAVIGSPFVYSTINPQVSYPFQQNLVPQSAHHANVPSPLGLTQSNYEEACKLTPPTKSTKPYSGIWRNKKRNKPNCESAPNTEQGDSSICSSINPHNRGKKTAHEATTTRDNILKPRVGNMDENRTDGESSYSSFYSSFFKTDSAEDSGDVKKANIGDKLMNPEHADNVTYQPMGQFPVNKIPKRKADAPWNEKVCVTSELIYKYQVMTKNMNEVLSADMQKINKLEQPSLVDEQLGQLYLDLQLQGVAARLTLEEGITSSASSGEESTTNATKVPRRKREYSKMELIYEENAPLPPPPEDEVTSLICLTP